MNDKQDKKLTAEASTKEGSKKEVTEAPKAEEVKTPEAKPAEDQPKTEADQPTIDTPFKVLEKKESEENQEDKQESETTEKQSDKPKTKKAQKDTTTSETSEEKEEVTNTSASSVKPEKGHWYVVHTYAGHENKVAETLKQRVETMKLQNKIFEVVVPTRNVVIVRHGKKEEVSEKIFPGYILVRMEMGDESWLAVRTTQGVTAFVGAGTKPTPISQKEVKAIFKFMKMDAPKYKTKFSVNEPVKIIDGPFADFLGTIESIDEEKGKVRVLVSIFGRETPVNLDFLQVKKL